MPSRPSFSKLLLSFFIFNLLLFATPVRTALAAPLLQLIGPTEGQKIESDTFIVSWRLTDFTLTDFATNPKLKTGQGHLHLWLDDKNPTSETAVKVVSGDAFTFENVKSGPHTLTVELRHNDHSALKPPVKQTVNFESSAPIFVNPQLPQNNYTLFLLLIAVILVGALWYFLAPETPATPASPKKKSRRSKK